LTRLNPECKDCESQEFKLKKKGEGKEISRRRKGGKRHRITEISRIK
jgi:hypothetical protein